jgi:hypothetical protein
MRDTMRYAQGLKDDGQPIPEATSTIEFVNVAA